MGEKEPETQGKLRDKGPGDPIKNRISIMSNVLGSGGGRRGLRKTTGCSNLEHTDGFQENCSTEGWKYKPG